jgi:hypothetical protein
MADQAITALDEGGLRHNWDRPIKERRIIMRLKYWLVAKAIVVVIFGIGFVLIPTLLGSIYGMSLDPAGVLMARLFGGGFIFEAIVLWMARNTDRDDVACRGIITGIVVSNTIGFIVCLLATLAGTGMPSDGCQ